MQSLLDFFFFRSFRFSSCPNSSSRFDMMSLRFRCNHCVCIPNKKTKKEKEKRKWAEYNPGISFSMRVETCDAHNNNHRKWVFKWEMIGKLPHTHFFHFSVWAFLSSSLPHFSPRVVLLLFHFNLSSVFFSFSFMWRFVYITSKLQNSKFISQKRNIGKFVWKHDESEKKTALKSWHFFPLSMLLVVLFGIDLYENMDRYESWGSWHSISLIRVCACVHRVRTIFFGFKMWFQVCLPNHRWWMSLPPFIIATHILYFHESLSAEVQQRNANTEQIQHKSNRKSDEEKRKRGGAGENWERDWVENAGKKSLVIF